MFNHPLIPLVSATAITSACLVLLNVMPLQAADKPAALQSRELAPLKSPVTSFGAAVAGGHLYVYGGQLGSAHKYSIESQSRQFYRLDLAKPVAWEAVGEVPRRTGLAMVAQNDKVYRIGGWEAKNTPDEKWNLHSTRDFSRFDPKSGQWQELAPLPAGRSSHDAATIGSKLYVVGGWELAGEGEGTWHDTALVCDLAENRPTWKEIAKPPYMRRALAVAGYSGKLYALGGMNDSNETILTVSVYDPAADKWSDGPSLPGKPGDAFGAAAFGIEQGLFATTAPGKLYHLAADGKSWNDAGVLGHARTFHRLLADESGALLAVGGTSPGKGKVAAVERLTLKRDSEAR